LGDAIFAVYYQYEGDYTKPFSYFIGCNVKFDAEVPQGLESLIISNGTYYTISAKGKMPDCMINICKEVWIASIPRTY